MQKETSHPTDKAPHISVGGDIPPLPLSPDDYRQSRDSAARMATSFDERIIALVKFLARRAAARDFALQLKIETAAEKAIRKGNT